MNWCRLQCHDPHPSSPDRSLLSYCGGGPRRHHPRQRRQGVCRRVERGGGVLPGAFASRRARRDARAARPSRLCAYQLFHDRRGGRAGRRAGRARAGRHRSCVFRERRVGSDRGRAQARAAIFCRAWRVEAAIRHRAPPELSRHNAGRAGGRRPGTAAQSVRSVAFRDAPCVPRVRISRASRE